MAVHADTHWDIRPATGNDANGGGFKQGASGVDYSQQTSPQYALTGVTSAGAGDTVLTASAATDMVGNVANVVSGTNFTTGRYQVVSVVAGVSITFGTNKAGGSICSGVGASGVLNIGGSLASIAALGLDTNADAYNSNVVWVKGTDTFTAAVQPNSHMSFAGYGTTHGDGTRATITTSTNSTKLFNYGNVYRGRYENFNFTSTAGTKAAGFSCANNWALHFKNCLFDGFLQHVFAGFPFVVADAQNSLVFMDCELRNATTTDGSVQLYDPRCVIFDGCKLHDNAGDDVQVNGAAGQGALVMFRNTRCYNSAGRGLMVKASAAGGTPSRSYHISNSVFAYLGADGIKIESTTYQDYLRVINTVFWDNGGFGVYRDTTTAHILMMYPQACAYGSNASGARGGMWPAAADDVTLTNDPFTDGPNGDFSLNADAAGGELLKAAGHEGL